jgi:hypothetical protein
MNKKGKARMEGSDDENDDGWDNDDGYHSDKYNMWRSCLLNWIGGT